MCLNSKKKEFFTGSNILSRITDNVPPVDQVSYLVECGKISTGGAVVQPLPDDLQFETFVESLTLLAITNTPCKLQYKKLGMAHSENISAIMQYS